MRARRRIPRNHKKIPNYWADRTKFDRHDVDDYSCWTDRSQDRLVDNVDPRTPNDSLDPDKPRGM